MGVVYAKLIRDQVPGLIEADGQRAVTRVLNDTEFRAALLTKLVEEALEARAAEIEDVPSELVDVVEVIQALLKIIGITWGELLELADDKREQRGGFSRRLFLEYVD
jgi:predicted house-cleaning noncanonical NTP pyrophosphatase (MazG superfamily)